MSDLATKTLSAKCFCGAVHFTVDIPTPQLPLAVRLCHCSLCRYVTGAPFIVHTTLPGGVKPQFIAPSSDYNITNYAPAGSSCTLGFCSTCGCHINARDPVDSNFYVVSSSIFSEQRPDCFQIKLHAFSKSAKDDGLSPMLTRIGDREMRVWNPPDNDPRAKIVEAEVEVGEDGQGRLRAQCHCGGVSFTIKRPSQEVIGDEWLSQFVSPLDESKWRASLDICDDCRLVTGTHVIGWTFVPLQCFEPAIKVDLKIGTAKTYVSSAGVLRSFCGTCGATVFYSHEDRQRGDGRQVVNLATGIIRAPEGSMAQNWLTWRSRIGWTESGKRFDKEFIEALEEGMTRWAVDTYGEKQTWKIG